MEICFLSNKSLTHYVEASATKTRLNVTVPLSHRGHEERRGFSFPGLPAWKICRLANYTDWLKARPDSFRYPLCTAGRMVSTVRLFKLIGGMRQWLCFGMLRGLGGAQIVRVFPEGQRKTSTPFPTRRYWFLQVRLWRQAWCWVFHCPRHSMPKPPGLTPLWWSCFHCYAGCS